MSKIIKIVFLFIVIAGNLFSPVISRAAAVKDSDYDGLSDQGEIQVYKTDPLNADTDGDGYLDGAEVLAGTNPLVAEVTSTTATSAQPATNLWPWYFTRASGLVAYFLLFLLLVSGIGIKTSWTFKILSPTFAWLNHRYIGIALTFSVIVHLLSLLVDSFLKFTILDVLVPFMSSFKPLYLSLGIIGFYLLVAVIISSIFTIARFPKAWRLLHYLPYPLFIVLFVHGYFIGTDTKVLAIKMMYLFTGIIITWLSLYRLYFFYKQK